MQHIRSLLVSFISKQFSLKRDQWGLLSAQHYIHTINRNDVLLYAHHTIWKVMSACFVQFWSGQTLTANILNILVTVPGVQCSILPLFPLFSLFSCSIQLSTSRSLSLLCAVIRGWWRSLESCLQAAAETSSTCYSSPSLLSTT